MSFIPTGEQKRKDKIKAKNESKDVVAKPITQSDDFCAELMDGVMDFSSIQYDENGNDRQFIVAVNTDSRNKPPILASTMRGVFDFFEMVEVVGCMWEREQHHAMVYILTKDFDKASVFLDEGTVDYIEANWEEIVSSGILEAALIDDDYEGAIIPAGIITSDADEE